LEVFNNTCKVICVLYLECPVDKCSQRISIRSQSSGRIDDNDNSLKKRFSTYEAETLPNLKNLEEISKVVRVMSDQSCTEVFKNICERLDALFEEYLE